MNRLLGTCISALYLLLQSSHINSSGGQIPKRSQGLILPKENSTREAGRCEFVSSSSLLFYVLCQISEGGDTWFSAC